MIGDPSGRDSERSLNTADTVKGFSDKLEQQLGQLLQFDDGENAVKARNNHDWLSSMTIIDFLRDTGKHFGDRKSTRLNSSHVAISYAVFCLKKKRKYTRHELEGYYHY